ncbi:hypothetical protein SLS62_002765 [Diatrype stigma]|uniref:Probable beta-glucosidase btgE n=1 Tax=Diatrype stigma TaxID=117547 RepID=A0AAN9UZN3_9PEZI
MKASFAAVTVAALAGTSAAATLHQRHGHQVFHDLAKKAYPTEAYPTEAYPTAPAPSSEVSSASSSVASSASTSAASSASSEVPSGYPTGPAPSSEAPPAYPTAPAPSSVASSASTSAAPSASTSAVSSGSSAVPSASSYPVSSPVPSAPSSAGSTAPYPSSVPSNGTEGQCGCTTIYSTYYGEATLHNPPPPPATSSSVVSSSVATSAVPSTYETTIVVVPTPVPHTPTATGVVTYPGTTLTLTSETTVAVPSTTEVPAGSHTIGGVTTVVTTATTVTCPYAAVETSEGVTTSVIKTTEYVCPSGGTYTIAPTTTYVDTPTTIVVPSVTSYPPGTYTQPDVVTTITDTKTVVYCPFEPITPTSVPAVPTSTPAPAPSSPSTPSSVAPPPTTVVPTTSSAPAPVPTTSSTVAYTTSSAPKPKPTGGNGGNLGGDTPGVPWGTTYTPYNPDTGDCMTQEEVEKDIAGLAAKDIKIVRTYSTDCSTLEFVGEACEKYGIQMMVGVFIDGSDGCSASSPKIADQISALKSWGKWDMVELVTVGNEAIINGYCSAAEIASLVETCKSEFSGYTGLYTTAETVNIWQEPETQSALCDVVDILGTNAHAFFNYQTTADKAGEFVKGQLDIVSNLCPGKEGIVLETGWPKAGTSLGLAVAGVAEQRTALDSIIKECGDKAVLFSLYDDKWKSANTECGICEQACKLSSSSSPI